MAPGPGRRSVVASILAALVIAAIPAAGAGGAGRSTAVLLAAGDIAGCDWASDDATAALLDANAGAVATLGDNAYYDGTASEFSDCYEPTWGRAKGRTRPAAGNHEYGSAGAAGYFSYFGAAAGGPDKGYYSYELGDWHVVVLNSNCTEVGGCTFGSAQELWLRSDLAGSSTRCTLAYWHHPRFSSGKHGSSTEMQAVWNDLYRAGADLVLSAHDHNYERFAPQNAVGTAAPAYGIREFVVGTGGAILDSRGTPVPNSQAWDSTTYGILKLSLRPTGYDWEFLPVAGQTFTDSGSTSCHSTPPSPSCHVPPLVGRHLGPAKNALRQARCTTGKVHYAKSRRARGIVISQSLRAGVVRPIGTRVSLTVSRGKR